MTTAQPEAGLLGELWTGEVIDTDVHAVVPHIDALMPYLDPVWVQHIEELQWGGPTPAATYPPATSLAARTGWRPADGRPAASDVSLLRTNLLDPWRVTHAIVNCLVPIDGGPPDLSAALASATNDWLAEHWLAADSRLAASITLPGPNDPAAMAREIERMGGHPGFVQALLPVRSGKLYGKRLFWPVFEALERHGIVAGLHFGGGNDGLPPTPAGFPAWVAEEYASEVQVFESQLISVLAEGVFQRFPGLRMSFLETGFCWLPAWMWDLDRNWKGIRREVPWLNRRPWEIVRDHIRFSTAPLTAHSPAELSTVIGWLRSDELLMFSSDYPHDHGDDVAVLLEALPEPVRARVMAGNAREWYRLGSGGAA